MNKTKTIKTKTRDILVVNEVILLLFLGIILYIVSSDGKNLLLFSSMVTM